MNLTDKKMIISDYILFLKNKSLNLILEKEREFFNQLDISVHLKYSELFTSKDKNTFENLFALIEKGQSLKNFYAELFQQKKLDLVKLINSTDNQDTNQFKDFLWIPVIHKQTILAFLSEFSDDKKEIISIINYLEHEYTQVQITFFDFIEKVLKSSEEIYNQKLQESEERLSLIFNSTSNLMLLVNVTDDGNFVPVSANKAYLNTLLAYNPYFDAKDFFGVTLDVISKNVFGFTKEVTDFVYFKYNEAIKAGHSINYEESIDSENSKYFAEITLTPIFNQNNKCTNLLYVSRDITARKLAELEVEKQRVELKRSNQELEEFASVASHDLQEPLRMVKQYLKLLQKRYKDKLDDNASEFINFAIDGSNRMEMLIKSLLDYARVGKSNRPLIITDFNIAVEQSLLNLKNLIDENKAQINYENLPVLKSDPIQITQLFQNLISNSIKYSIDKAPVINITAHQSDNDWIFSVKDNGIGIEKKYFDKIFQLFKRLHTENEYSGVGIGLAVCKKIIENYGGKIWLESEINQGTTFYFNFPIK